MVVELSGMSEWLIYVLMMALGAGLAVVVPYLLNVWVDPETKANWKYVATLVFGIGVTVLFASPNTVDAINLDAIKAAILSGYGLQAAVNKIVSSVLKKRAQEQEG